MPARRGAWIHARLAPPPHWSGASCRPRHCVARRSPRATQLGEDVCGAHHCQNSSEHLCWPVAAQNLTRGQNRGHRQLVHDRKCERQSAAHLRQAATDPEEFTTKVREQAESSELLGKAIQAKHNYDSLKASLEDATIEDPKEFSSLIQQRQAIEGQLRHLDQIEHEIQTLNSEARDVLADLEALHLDLAEQRRAFLGRTLTGNPFVRMMLVPFGNDPAPQESDFRKSIAKVDRRLATDIWDPGGSRGILADLYRGLETEPSDERAKEVLRRVRTIKRDILAEREEVGSTDRTKSFRRHIRSLPPEQIDRLQLWWPVDTLQIEYRRPQRSGWSPLESGSPGQQSAALLAFLLSYGEEPLILDQPKDDLDNHLIYDC